MNGWDEQFTGLGKHEYIGRLMAVDKELGYLFDREFAALDVYRTYRPLRRLMRHGKTGKPQSLDYDPLTLQPEVGMYATYCCERDAYQLKDQQAVDAFLKKSPYNRAGTRHFYEGNPSLVFKTFRDILIHEGYVGEALDLTPENVEPLNYPGTHDLLHWGSFKGLKP